MKILGIESSCDETAASVAEDGRNLLSNVVASQIDIRAKYGGVVPEIASRAHTEAISGVVEEALSRAGVTLGDIDAIAVTYAPGLIGALLTGVSFAKGLAYSAKKPLVPVHHIRGHVAANYLVHPELEPPFIALVVSGGHTSLMAAESYTEYRLIGSTTPRAKPSTNAPACSGCRTPAARLWIALQSWAISTNIPSPPVISTVLRMIFPSPG